MESVVFVCLHGAAKSVIAAAHFDRLASARGLGLRATCMGTAPDPAIPPPVVAGLATEGIDVRGRAPRGVVPAELARATRVVSFGCDLSAAAPGVRVERWDEVPAVSDGFAAARNAIVARVTRLVDGLAAR